MKWGHVNRVDNVGRFAKGGGLIGPLMSRLRTAPQARPLRRLVQASPHYQQLPTGGIRHHTHQRFGAGAHAVAEWLTMSSVVRNRLRETRKCADSFSGPVLLLASGPSSGDVIAQGLERIRSRGIAIAVMNDFYLLPESHEFSPDMYFLSDPAYWDDPTLEGVWDYLRDHPNTMVVQPAIQSTRAPNSTLYGTHVLWPRTVKRTNPTKLGSMPESVALTALITLNFLGFYPIYVAGLEVSTYLNYRVGFDNRLWRIQNGLHVHNPTQDLLNETLRGPTDPTEMGVDLWSAERSPLRNMADVMYSHAVFLRDLKRLAGGFAVNVGNDHTNDALPRGCLWLGGSSKAL